MLLKQGQRRSSLLFFVILMIWGGGAAVWSEPDISERTIYYDVQGTSVKALRVNMTRSSPIKWEGKKYDAFTKWYVRWRFEWENNEEECSISSVTTTVEVVFTYPRWTDEGLADPTLQAKWERYMGALIKHEEGHRDIAVDAANEIEAELSAMDAYPSGPELERAANKLANQVLKKFQEREKEYDKSTDHGRKDGAVFP